MADNRFRLVKNGSSLNITRTWTSKTNKLELQQNSGEVQLAWELLQEILEAKVPASLKPSWSFALFPKGIPEGNSEVFVCRIIETFVSWNFPEQILRLSEETTVAEFLEKKDQILDSVKQKPLYEQLETYYINRTPGLYEIPDSEDELAEQGWTEISRKELEELRTKPINVSDGVKTTVNYIGEGEDPLIKLIGLTDSISESEQKLVQLVLLNLQAQVMRWCKIDPRYVSRVQFANSIHSAEIAQAGAWRLKHIELFQIPRLALKQWSRFQMVQVLFFEKSIPGQNLKQIIQSGSLTQRSLPRDILGFKPMRNVSLE